MQFGEEIAPFGADRLKVVDFLYILVQLKNDLLSQSIDELEIPKALLSLMGEYFMNSILHGKIFNIFAESINSGIDYLIDTVRK